MTKKFLASTLRLGLLIILLAGLTFPTQYPVYALTTLTVQPLTWNVIGLDSNNVNVGPNHFPVGARVCNTGAEAATNVTADWVWDSTDPYIDLRGGTLSSINLGTLTSGNCADAYFEVEIDRDSNAYDHTREYHIEVTAGNVTGTISLPRPREVYVEYLISQNRNAVTDIQYGSTIPSLTSVAPGGTMSLIVGNTYFIRLVGNTATQGYEQLESFINIPNVIFQTLSVSTTYTADTSATVSSPNDKAYGDACVWENNPNSPNYRSCLSTGKVGGNITVTYQVKILQVPGAPLVNPAPLSSLIYDFSGSSYHYNADYDVSTRYAFILDPSTLTISKNFNPDPANAGGISTLTFTLTNPNAASVSGLNFTDTLPTTPGAMTVANPTNASTSGCGSPTFAPVAGAGSISFSNGTIAANSTCTIKLNVTVPVTGTYTNTSSNLFINSLDTGNSTTDPLTVNTTPPAPSPVCGLTMAQWTFAGFTIDPPPFPAPNTQAANVTTAAISVGNGLTAVADTSASGGNPQPGIRTYGWQNAGPIITLTSAYIQFAIDTSQYSQVAMQFDAQRKANGPNNDELYYSTNGTTWTLKSTFNSTTSWATYGAYDFTGQTNAAGVTYFRIYGYGANATSSGNDFNFDNVTFTGCAIPVPPAITKAFSPNPIAINGTSTLTFTLSNSNSIVLTGVTFTDSLPSGLQVAATPSAATTCGGIPTWAPTAGATSLTFGSPTGATIPASGSCTVSVNVTGTVDGSHQNVSGFISSTNGGTNTGSTGSASATLTVLKPPAISKLFAPNPILANGTSTLTFSISNPNLNNALTGVAFSDNYPAGVTNTNPLSTSNSCGGTLTLAAGGNLMSLSGGTVAGGASCIITTTVTASSVGTYANTSGAVSSANGGTGNTASDTLTVNAPNPAIGILKQVSNSASGPWTSFLSTDIGNNVFYRLTIENTGDVALTNVSVNDPTVSTAGCSWVDGDGTVLGPAPISLPVADVNDNQIATCVLGPITAVEGINPNTATATGTYSATPYMDTSTATYGTTELTLDKTVAETSFNLSGDTLNYSYLVTNSGYAPLLGPVTVTDDKATVTCPAVNTVGDLDDWLDPGESVTCSATYTVTLSDVIAGSVTNTASAAADGVTSNSDSEKIYREIADLIVTKSNNVSGTVAAGNSFNWTITVDNTGAAAGVFGLGNVILSDTLPGAAGYYPQGPVTVTNGGIAPIGTINCSITGTDLSCTANTIVTMPIGASFSVTFTVTPTVAGDLANTATVDPNGNIIELNETNNSDLDTVTVVGPPSISKNFAPDPIFVNGTSTLSFTITNPNTGTALTGVGFTDPLPAGLQVALPPNDTTSAGCGAPTFAPAAGNTTLTFSGGTILASGTCTVTVDVTATTDGLKINTSESVTSTNGGTGNTASDTLTVNLLVDVSLDKQVSNATPNVGDTVTFTLVIANGGPSTATNIDVTDIVPDGYTYVGSSITGGDINDDTDPVGTGLTWTINSLAGSASVNLTYQATVLASGTYDNYAEVTEHDQTDSDSTPGDGSNGDDDDDTQVVTPVVADLALTKILDTVGPFVPGQSMDFTITVTNNGPDMATGLNVTDTETNLTVTNVTSTDFTCAGNAFPCTLASLTNGASATITVTADIDAAGAFDNEATVTSTSNDPDPSDNTDNDGDTATVSFTPPTFSKSFSPDTILTGQVSTLTFTIDNTANVVDAASLDFTDNLPAGAVIANPANSSTTCTGGTLTATIGAGVLSYTGGTVSSGASCTVQADVTSVAHGVYLNTTGDLTSSLGNSGTASDTLTVNPTVDLSLTKTVDNSTPLVATNIAFTLTVTNVDPIDATNVFVTDVLPAGFSYVTDNGGGAYNNGTGVWTIGTITANSSATLTVTVSVNVTGPYTNYAEITGVDQVDPNSTPGNNSTTEDDDDSVTVNPTQNNPSGLTKSISNSNQTFTTNPNVAIGEIVEYTVNVNIPPGVFPNSQMVDTMERGLSFMSCASITPSDAGLTTDVAGSFASACSAPTVDDAGGGTTVDVGRRVTFDLGTLTNTSGSDQTLTFVYTAVVLDSAANVSGVVLGNSAAWTSDSGTLPPASASVLIVEPDLSISKTANTSLVSVGSEVIITMAIQHTGNSEINAYDTVVTDVLPAELQYVPGSLNCTPGVQDPDVACVESGGTITTEWSNFALGGGNGQVTFRVTVVSLPASGISNVANVAWSSLPGVVGVQNDNVFSTERDYDPASNVDVYGASDTLVIGVFNNQLPDTGFAPNVVTDLGNGPSVVYQQTGGVTVEVPSLGINLSIVGVPLKDATWDVSWLGNQAGWLDGSAFPTWNGNSVLTGHVYGSNGLPGPFVNLITLKYGDKIVVHAYGQRYTYEVRTNTIVDPNNASVFAHEDRAWLTLVTCKEYDEKTNTYGKRVVVRAVLVGVGWE